MGAGLPESVAAILGGSPDDYRPRIPSQRRPRPTLYADYGPKFDWGPDFD